MGTIYANIHKYTKQNNKNTKTAIARATGRPRSSRDVHFVANRTVHLLKISANMHNIRKYTQKYKKKTIIDKNGHSSSHRPPQKLSRRSFCSKSRCTSFEDKCEYAQHKQIYANINK